jgi:hypothetical protein
VALDVGQSIVARRPPEPPPEQALDRHLPVRRSESVRDGDLDCVTLAHLRLGPGAHAQADRLPPVENRAAVEQLRRARVRGEHLLKRGALGFDPAVAVLDEGSDLGVTHPQRRHDLDPGGAHGDAQALCPRAPPKMKGDCGLDGAGLQVPSAVEALAERHGFRFGRLRRP